MDSAFGHPARGRLGVAALVTLALMTLMACSKGKGSEGIADAGAVVLGPENLAQATSKEIQAGPRVAGSLQPQEQAVLRAEVAGSVVQVSAEMGDGVKAGQSLGRIEANTLQDTLLSAQSAMSSAESDLEIAQRQVQRTERLVQAGALSERDLELAKSAASAAQARVKQSRASTASAKKILGDATVRAPFAGVVSQRQVSQGDIVQVGTPLFTVIDPSSMRLEASVPSEQLPHLRVGAQVSFEVRGYPGQTFAGKIERVAPAADAATRQIPVLVAIPNPGGKLVAGLFAEGRVTAQSRVGIVVPERAVEEVSGKATVKRIRDGKVEEVQVKLGLRDERSEEVELLEGVRANDWVLVGAAKDDVSAGMPVTVRRAAAANETGASGGGGDAGT